MRSTELKYLARLANGTITPADEAALLKKVGKKQSQSRARDITDDTEAEYAAILAQLTPVQQQAVAQAISDYTQSSAFINNYLRGDHTQDMSGNIARIDAMFQLYAAIGADSDDRVTYRLASYKPTTGFGPPYTPGPAPAVAAAVAGAASAPIYPGDTVTDDAYVSASENRQLLVKGIDNAPAGTRYAKFVIVGRGGINISGGSLYNNANTNQLHQMASVLKRLFTTPEAGQAEILYPHGTVFRVEDVKIDGQDVHVRLTIPQPQPGAGGHKNMFSGL